MRFSRIWFVIVGAAITYGVVAISTPTVLHAQSVQGSIPQTTDTLNEAPLTDTTASVQMAHRADQQNPDSSSDAEIDHRFNELRRELLDDRASTINWWLAIVALVLTFFAIVVPIAGLFGFREFREIKKGTYIQSLTRKKQHEKAHQRQHLI